VEILILNKFPAHQQNNNKQQMFLTKKTNDFWWVHFAKTYFPWTALKRTPKNGFACRATS